MRSVCTVDTQGQLCFGTNDIVAFSAQHTGLCNLKTVFIAHNQNFSGRIHRPRGQARDVVQGGFQNLDPHEISGAKSRSRIKPRKQKPPGLTVAHCSTFAADLARRSQVDTKNVD